MNRGENMENEFYYKLIELMEEYESIGVDWMKVYINQAINFMK